MQFTCLQENLSKSLSTVYKAIPNKGSLPILSNVLLNVSDGQLRIAATNLDVSIITTVGASVDSEGSITVPAKVIREFVSNLSPGPVEAELKKQALHLSSGKHKTTFNGMSSADYPELPFTIGQEAHLELDPKAFSDAISLVSYCVSADESRPVYTGILFSYQDGKLTLASSDGFRLSEQVLKVVGKIEPFSIIVPARTLTEVARTFSSSDNPIKFVFKEEDNQVLFECDETLFVSRIINGDFPAYQAIIPQESHTNIKVNLDEFLRGVKLTHVFAKENDSNVIKLKIEPNGNLIIQSDSQEIGNNVSEIPAEITGNALEAAFNATFLLDYLNSHKAENIILQATEPNKPFLIKEDNDNNHLHVLMPIGLNE